MKTVSEIRGMRTFAGPGVYGYDAEAAVRDEDGKTLYVYVNGYEGLRHYVVAEKSLYDEMTAIPVVAGNEDMPPLITDPEFERKMTDWLGKWGEAGEDGYVEEYRRLSDARESAYYDVFLVLSRMIGLMEKGIS